MAFVMRAMAIFERTSGLPEDKVVNTFHFAVDDTKDRIAADLEAQVALNQFYFDNPPNQTRAVASYFSADVKSLQIRTYNLADTDLPRQPIISAGRVFPAYTAATALPAEVAVTASYYADRNLPRTRGRIYIGPLKGDAITNEASPRVHSTFQAILVGAAARLRDSVGTSGIRWGVYSQTGITKLRPITHVYCDNALDTQRRRGVAATSRVKNPA